MLHSCTRVSGVLVICLCMFSGMVAGVHGDEVDASRAELADEVEKALRFRLAAMQNSEIVSTTRMFNQRNGDGVGEVVADSGWYRFKLMYLKGSYCLEYEWHETQEATVPSSQTKATFRDSDSMRTAVGSHINVEGVYARVDREHDANMYWNRTAAVLGISAGADSVPILREAIDSRSDWRVTRISEGVSIEYGYKLPFIDEPKGIRSIICDPTKGYAPVRMQLKWDAPEIGNGAWREEDIELRRFAKIDNIWIPQEIIERVKTSNLEKGVVSVMTTKVDSLRFGVVRESDLRVDIPPGTEVVHVIDGTTYVAGENAVRLNEVSLAQIGGAKGMKGEVEAVRGRRWLLIGTIVLVAVLFISVAAKRIVRSHAR